MRYHQITPEERYTLATLRKQEPKLSNVAIARLMQRHPSTISRELRRNSTPYDGAYRPSRAQEQANGRRSRSRRNSRFQHEHWQLIEQLLRADFSPEQISGRLRRDEVLRISHETIYQRIWADKRCGGTLFRRLRQRPKYRKRYGTNEKRGRLLRKRHISERPLSVEHRQEFGHWEMDTVIGSTTNHCILTLVERSTGCVLITQLAARNAAAVNRRLLQLITDQPHPVPHHHRRQRNRVPRLQTDRTGHGRSLLLRHPVSLLGARNQREHQRPHSPIPTQTHHDERPHPVALQPDRLHSQQPTPKTPRLPHPHRAIISSRRCCSSNLNLGRRPVRSLLRTLQLHAVSYVTS